MASPSSKPSSGAAAGEVSLESLRERLADFADARDWNQFHSPRNLMLAMVGEVGELSELFQWRGDDGCKPGLPSWKAEDKVHLGEELSDVLLYLIRLADRCGVDLSEAALRKLAKNAEKYPASVVRGAARKYNEYSDADLNGFADKQRSAEERAQKKARTQRSARDGGD